MNIEERLTQLMETKGINKAQLSKGSNIPYTTVDGMFKKGCENIKLSNLIKLADYFGVSIDYLVGRSDEEFSLEEVQKIKTFEKFLIYERSNNGQN